MTNEEFLRDLKFANRACTHEISEAFEYARKLVAVAEATVYMYDSAYLASDEENFIVEADNMIKVREALAQLEDGK